MSILSDFEDRVANAVEGVFAGVFRAPVQPAELARAAAKEMDKRKKLGVGKVYAPTLYSILLSPADGEQLGGFASTLAGELETYLVGYARQKGYQLSTKPRVQFLVDEGLKLGRFEVIGELLSADEIAAELGEDDGFFHPEDAPTERPEKADSLPASAAAPAALEVPAVAAAAPEPVGLPIPTGAIFDADHHVETEPAVDERAFPQVATVTIPGVEHDVALTGEQVVLGRLKACDICLEDQNASRRHAMLEREGGGWAVADLGSTNGTLLNGARVDRARLRDGDVITIGITELVYHDARPTR